MKKATAVLLVVVIISSGCAGPTGNSIAVYGAGASKLNQFANETLPLKVAKLQPMELESVDSFEKYKSFADNLNDLIKILNEQTDMFNIAPLNPTFEGWTKASKTITEYGPLINNYNGVINTAKEFEHNPNEDTRQKFYFASGKFAFETTIIVGAVFYTASYQTIGIAYRSLGVNTFALKCSSCVSVILSQAHWTVRTVLVETASQGAQKVLDAVEEMQKSGTFDKINEASQDVLYTGRNATREVLNKLNQKR